MTSPFSGRKTTDFIRFPNYKLNILTCEMKTSLLNMKIQQKIRLLLVTDLVLLSLYLPILFLPYQTFETDADAEISSEVREPCTEYLNNSGFEAIIDTTIDIYELKTGIKISSLPVPDEQIKSMAIHPSGTHLLILDEYTLHVYDLKKDDLSNTDNKVVSSDSTPTNLAGDTPSGWADEMPKVWTDIISEVDVRDVDIIEFSTNGKYLLSIDKSYSKVEIYRWPGLEYLTTQYMGLNHNFFWWEKKADNVIFYYQEKGHTYRTVFPCKSIAGLAIFSKPVCI